MNKHQSIVAALLVFTTIFVSPAFGNVVGSDTNNFNPTTSGLDFITVESSETLEPGIVNLGLWFNYAVNTLPHFDDLQSQSRVDLNDTLLFSDFNIGLGLGPNWDVGMSFPVLLSQTVTTGGYSGYFDRKGLTEVRWNTKYRLWGNSDHGFALMISSNINTIANNPFTGQGAGPTYNFQAIYDHTFGRVAAAANVGYRIRQPGDPIPNVPVSPFHNSYIGSLAASYLLPSYDTKIVAELFGSYPVEKAEFQSDRSQSTLEALAGVKHDFTHYLAMSAGIGTEVFNGTASPDWRVFAGLNYTFGPIFGGDKPSSAASSSITEVVTGKIVQEAVPQKGDERFRAQDILFEFNSDAVKKSSMNTLQTLAQYLMKKPQFKHLVIEGHTDSVGSINYNVKLSQRRADNIKRVLVESFSVPGDRIETIGNGPSRPIADNGNFQGRQRNRRVEFIITR